MDGDFSRALVSKGREQARRAAKFLKSADVLPAIVLTSPLLRARQTAEEFCQAAGMPGPVIVGWLASGMNAEAAIRELTAFRDFKRVAIVGHEPDFSELAEYILEMDGGSIEMKKGSIACLRITPPSRYGTLAYLIPPKLAEDAE